MACGSCPVPGKGLGIVAKKLIPAGYRILVEPLLKDPAAHKAIKDLMPKLGSLQFKYTFNMVGCNDEGAPRGVSLRVSRLNHSCTPNALNYLWTEKPVSTLVALKQIQPGEEIARPTKLLTT